MEMAKQKLNFPSVDDPLWDEQHNMLTEHYHDVVDALEANDQNKAVAALEKFIESNSLHFE